MGAMFSGQLVAAVLVNANVYVNGSDMLGRAAEVDLPQIKHKTYEYKGLGMAGSVPLWAGIDKMEAKITWAWLDPEYLGPVLNPFSWTSLVVRADMQVTQSGGMAAELPVTALMTAMFHEAPHTKLRMHEPQTHESALTVYYYKLQIAGLDQIEIDALANIFRVQGVDQLAAYRANLGEF